MYLGLFRRLDHLVVGGVDSAVADIFEDGAREQEHLLLHDPHVLAQGSKGDPLDVPAVNTDFTRIGLVKTRDQVAKRCLLYTSRCV